MYKTEREKLSRAQGVMHRLAKGWEEEANFLSNPLDDPADRMVGKAYRDCANTLFKALKKELNES